MAARHQERDQVEKEATKREGPPREAAPLSAAAIETKRTTSAPPEPGVILDDRYELEEIVGQGGAGIVFRARDKLLGERVAVKILHRHYAADTKWRKRLSREVTVARAIRHPNVCRVFELGHSNDDWYVTMEFGAGTLRDDCEAWSKTCRPPFSSRLADAQALCNGLAAIHAVGIIHRDVTPSNILRMRDGRLVVTDFGLAIGANDKTTFHGGVPKYMAPEVLAGAPADQRADVWQLGLLLHELLFGRPVWTEDRTALVSPLATVGDGAVEHELWSVCTSCLAPNAALRPASAVVVAGALAAAAAAKPYTRLVRVGRRIRQLARRPWLRRCALVAAFVGAGVMVAPRLLKPPLCRGGAARVANLWDETRQASVRKSFADTSPVNGANAFDRVDRIMREYATRWASAYTEACEATNVHGEQSLEVLDLRMSCLNEELEGAGALVSTFSSATETVVANAVQAAATFGDLHRCNDARALRGVAPLPEDPKKREAIARLRSRLAAVKSRAETGDVSLISSDLPHLEEEAKATGFCPAIAEALAVRGHIESWMRTSAAKATLEAAVYTAERCGADQVVATAATSLVYPDSEKDIEVADQWARLAAAVIQRIGGNLRLEAWLLNNMSAVSDIRGDRKAAIDQQEKALALKERLLGRDHLDVGISLGNLADLLIQDGRAAEALAAGRRSVEILEKWLGPDHVNVAVARVQRGDSFEGSGFADAAAADFKVAIASFKRNRLDDPRQAYARAGLGRLAQKRGDLRQAIAELTTARAFLEQGPDQFTLARVEFDLARARYDNGERTEGRTLAASALKRYQKGTRLLVERDQVSTWLASHHS